MGLTSSGKSRQAKNIATYFRLSYISGSEMLLDKLKYSDNSKEHFWLEESGAILNEQRYKSNYDKEVDERLMEMATKMDNLVFDSWTIPWLYYKKDAVRIYLNPTLEFRATLSHKSKTDKKYTIVQLMDLINEKDKSSRKRFIQMYGFDIYDKSNFDLVFDNSFYKVNDTTAYLIDFIKKHNQLLQ